MRVFRSLSGLVLLLLPFALLLTAQGPPPHDGPPPRRLSSFNATSRKWWNDPTVIQRLGLTNEQQQRLEESFQNNRIKLIDLTAAVDKAAAVLEPLLAADRPDDGKVFAQIDRVAQARAALESATSRMLYSFRLVLTAEQWRQLQLSDHQPHMPPGGPPPRH